MKKGDIFVIADDDDDKVRTNASQNHVMAALCTEESFLRTQYICSSHLYHQRCVGGQDIYGQHDTIDSPG